MDATAEELIARLRRNPDDASAYAALRAHYQRIGDYPSLTNLLEGWASRSPDPAAAAQAFFEAGELARDILADRARSMRCYECALQRNPAHLEASLRLQAALEEIGDQRRLAELLEGRAEVLARLQADPREIAAVHHRLGQIWQHAFQRADQAILHYRKAFELDPTLVPAIYAAREIYRQAGNTQAVAALCDLEAKAEPDPERKVALFRELAHVRAHELGDFEGAVVALKRALTIAPGHLEAMQELARIYLLRATRGHDPMVADADRRRAADLLFQVAQKLGPADAVAHLETALDAVPDHEGALALLERIAEHVGHMELLPNRWVAFLARAPNAPTAHERRQRLARAYLDAGQVEYAISCLEWLLDEGDAEAASQLVDLYRRVGRTQDVPRALAVATAGLPPAQRVPHLREAVAMLHAAGDEDGAIHFARQILEIDPADPEALAAVEDHYRRRGNWEALRDLLLRAARVPGLSVEARKTRLREVASISERRLGDVEGAIGAWKGIAALDPSDREARGALLRLLEQHRRWDDLVQVLEREAAASLEPQVTVDIYRRLVTIHRDERRDLRAAIAALRRLRELVPHDVEARDALCDLLLETGAWEEGVMLLRERVEDAAPPLRTELLRLLAQTIEERLSDLEGAFTAWARLLEDEPGDREALARMEAIAERQQQWERLLQTLSYRADLEERAVRVEIWVRMARIADEKLGDLAQAAELYGRAYELAAGDEAILDALCDVYDRSQRYRDLVLLLRERARHEHVVAVRAALFRRIARTLHERIGNDEGAAEAYREVLAAGEDREALSFLRDRARMQGDLVTLDELTERLAAVAEHPDERRDLLAERAELLAQRLGRPHDAIAVLRHIVQEVDRQHVPSLRRLAELCESIGDRHGLADALERTLAILEDPAQRVSVARQLADLYQYGLGDRDRAIAALHAWADADLTDPDPLRRLIELLEPAERWKDLVIALDSLADLLEDDREIGSLTRRAADLAFRKLGEVDGAWERLAPRVGAGDTEAEAQIRELARRARLGSRLVELYASLAENASDATLKKKRWIDAAKVYEEDLGDAGAALEAYLKAFTCELDDLALLDEVDRLAIRARAWPRIAQVYETLIRRSEDKGAKVALLLRHAAMLDRHAGDPSAALDRVLRACALDPGDDRVLAVAEDLAPRAGRSEELLVVYDRRRAAAKDDAGRVEALLRSARLSEVALGNREQAISFIAQAVALSVRSPELGDTIESAVRALDRPAGRGGKPSLLRGLVDVCAAIAEDMESDPRGGAKLLLRASVILERDLGDDEGAWGALVRATMFAPDDDTALDAIESFAVRKGRLPALDRHFGELVEEAIESSVASKLLRRRGALLERLGRYSDAADVYAQLKNVAPQDLEARNALRRALHHAGRYQDLLLALDSDLAKAKGNRAFEIALRKEVAITWERGLRNRWEALEAWQAVAKLAPDDPETREALARLGQDKHERKLSGGSNTDDSLEMALAPTGRIHAMDPASNEFTDPGIDALSEPGLDPDVPDDYNDPASVPEPGASFETLGLERPSTFDEPRAPARTSAPAGPSPHADRWNARPWDGPVEQVSADAVQPLHDLEEIQGLDDVEEAEAEAFDELAEVDGMELEDDRAVEALDAFESLEEAPVSTSSATAPPPPPPNSRPATMPPTRPPTERPAGPGTRPPPPPNGMEGSIPPPPLPLHRRP